MMLARIIGKGTERFSTEERAKVRKEMRGVKDNKWKKRKKKRKSGSNCATTGACTTKDWARVPWCLLESSEREPNVSPLRKELRYGKKREEKRIINEKKRKRKEESFFWGMQPWSL
jgi:hypothetical protein